MADNNASIQVSLDAIQTVRAGVLKRMQDVLCAMAEDEECMARDWKYRLEPLLAHLEQLDEYEAALRKQLAPKAGFFGFGGVGMGTGRGVGGVGTGRGTTWKRFDERREMQVPLPRWNEHANDWGHPDHICPVAGTPEVMSDHMRMCCRGGGFSFPKR